MIELQLTAVGERQDGCYVLEQVTQCKIREPAFVRFIISTA